MKKFLLLGTLCVMVVGATTALLAAGANMNNNLSAEYCKTLNRQASTEPDAAFFNPAGTAFMADGLYLYLSNQTVWQPISIKVRGGDANIYAGASRGEYNGAKYAWFYPNGYLVYKKDNWAFSANLMGIGGGGTGEFKNGLQEIDVTLNKTLGVGANINALYGMFFPGVSPVGSMVFSKFSGSSAIYCGQVNGAYAFIKDKFSLSLGVRAMLASSVYDAKLWTPGAGSTTGGILPGGSDFHTNQQGLSWGLIFGISAKPTENLTIGIKTEWNAPLRLNAKSHDSLIVGLVNSGYQNQGKTHMQLPANIDFGIAYKIGGLTISPSFVYWFNQFAQMKQKEKDYIGGYDVGCGFDYTLSQIPLNIGIGYLWSTSGARPSARSQLSEELDSHSLSFGFSWSFNDNVKLTLSEILTRYVPVNVNEGATSILKFIPARFHKDSFDTSIGITAKVI